MLTRTAPPLDHAHHHPIVMEGRSMSAALDDYRDLRDRERDRERMMRDDRYLPPRRERYAPYYRDDLHYPPPPHSYSKMAPGSLRRDEPKDKISSSSSSALKDIKDDKPIPSTSSEPYGRYVDWRERRYRDEERRRDYDRRYMRYDAPAYGPPPFSGEPYRSDRDLPPSPGIPYYERDRLDDRDYYRRPPPSDYDRYRPNSSSSARGIAGRPSWRPQPDDRRMMDRERDREKPYNNFNSRMNDPVKPQQPLIQQQSQPQLQQQQQQQPQQQPQQPQAQAQTQQPQPQTQTQTQLQKQQQAPPQQQPQLQMQAQALTQTQPNTELQQQPSIQPIPQSAPQQSIKKEQKILMSEEVKTQDTEMKTTTPEQIMTEIKSESAQAAETMPKKEPVKLEEQQQQLQQTEVFPESSIKQDTPEKVVVKEEGQERPVSPARLEMTQEQIVERIDHIENEISRYEEMLEAATKREEEENKMNEEPEMADDEDEEYEAVRKAQHEEARKQALQAMDEDTANTTNPMELTDSPVMRKRPQLLINQLRGTDESDERLCEQILQDNRKVAKENSKMIGGWQNKEENMDDWSEEEKWSKPLYNSIEEYTCYQNNINEFEKLRVKISNALHIQDIALKKKERYLKNEFKLLYGQWKEKNLALDRIRNHEQKGSDKYHRGSNRRRDEPQSEEYIDNVIFVAGAPDALRFKNDGTSTPYANNGLYTSDAARSEAELLEIIQSLETAEMRNPESRAKKTTATIPPMILDVRERMRTFDDRSGLVEDPLSYYHTGPDTGDIWNQQEVTTFMESYMMYPKQFERISRAIGTKTAPQCVLFYYRKKKKIDFKALMKKGRRGKANKHRDRIAAAIRAVTGESGSTTRKAKSKGSALMADIGEAQNSRKAKEKDAERKNRELRELEQANTYWGTVAERKKSKRPTSSASDDPEMMLQETKRRPQPQQQQYQQQQQQRRKGRSPRESMQLADLIYPNDVSRRTMEGSGEEEDEKVYSGGSTKWTDREKETVIEAFKQYGRNFSRVSSLLPSKTEEQVRNFYHNFKRKNGPNVFNEENNNVRDDTANSFSGRTDLKAEEEDAAAALVGMFQMGANREDVARSRTPSSYEDIALGTSTPPPQLPPGGGIVGAQRRRRVRTTSGRTENNMVDDDWTDGDYVTKSGNRKLGRTASLTDKRSSYSSYWSVSERNDFLKYLEMYGRDWEKLANAMKSKTVIQVRNFYANNEDKMQLKEIVDRFHSRQRGSSTIVSPSFEKHNNAHHFQTLQTYSYSSPIHSAASTPISQPSTSSHAYPMGPSMGYFPPENRAAHAAYSETARVPSQQQQKEPEPMSSAVTKVADLLNNEDPAETNQNSWETWFGS
ncbi:hypothetical protein G6F44_010625 [Rhizopus delemar]|nr:hypothetical protein G6F44_010625 [Rhizopus delemar]